MYDINITLLVLTDDGADTYFIKYLSTISRLQNVM